MPAYRIASTQDEYTAALRMVYEAYRHLGYICRNPERLRVIPQHHHEATEILIAEDPHGIAATTTLVVESGGNVMPMRSLFSDELWRWRSDKCAEASCLASRQSPKVSLSIIAQTMALTIQVADARGVDYLCGVVHPHHLDFYTGFFGFESLGEVKHYEAVNGSPAVAIRLDLTQPEKMDPRAYRRVFEPAFPESVLRKRDTSEGRNGLPRQEAKEWKCT